MISGLIVGKPMDNAFYDEYKQILKEELSVCDKDDVKNFNYVRFMEKYDLVTTLDEELVKEEFLKLIS